MQAPPQPPVSPYLTVENAARMMAFYKEAFGAIELTRQPMPGTDKLMHVAFTINGGLVMMSDDFPEKNDGTRRTPVALGGTAVTIHLDLADVDAVWARAVAAGAKVVMPLADMFWGDRYGVVEDPSGHRWSLATRKTPA
jgi:PhnB protein